LLRHLIDCHFGSIASLDASSHAHRSLLQLASLRRMHACEDLSLSHADAVLAHHAMIADGIGGSVGGGDWQHASGPSSFIQKNQSVNLCMHHQHLGIPPSWF
jgi:hypothetical protein